MLRIIMVCVAALAVCRPLWAETSCSVEVNYAWKRGGKEEQKVMWGLFAAKGGDEAAAKSKLEALVNKERGKARERCLREHENLAGCISSKFSAKADIIRSLSFTGRKALETAIASDCQAAQGICGDAASSEPKCAEVKTAEEAKGKAEEKGKEPPPEAKKKKK
jgi:hypothetical protein